MTQSLFPNFPELTAGISSREGGVSPPPLGMNLSFTVGDDPANVTTNRRRFFGSLGVGLERVAFQRQIHSATVRIITGPGTYPDTDGLITQAPGVVLAVSIADCQPVLMYDPVTSTIAGVHSGWRGTEARILEAAVRMMSTELGVNPENIHAWLGPCAGGCCYEVGEEVASKFGERYIVRRSGAKPRLDIGSSNRDMLLDLGLPAAQLVMDGRCTIHNPDRFHSFRRDGARSGRMLAAIGFSVEGDRQ